MVTGLCEVEVLRNGDSAQDAIPLEAAMANEAEERELLTDLSQSADAIGHLAESEETFRAALDAVRASDAESFHQLLKRHELLPRCGVICHWFASKESVLLCLELCGPPKLDDEPPDIREFAEVVARVTADEELVEVIAQAVEERDPDAWRKFIEEQKLERFCHLLCHWVSCVRYRLICQVVCPPVVRAHPHLIAELQSAGAAIGRLAADDELFATAVKAVRAQDCELLRGTLGRGELSSFCRIICEWFCSWRCLLVCLPFCRAFPLEIPESPIGEALEFARAVGKLRDDPGALERLSAAVGAEDVQAFEPLVKELGFERFCIQLCHWLCYFRCRRFCFCVCPNPEDVPHWTQVEVFDIRPPAGNPGAMFTADGYAGHPATLGTDAFVFGELPTRGGVILNGNCPLTNSATGNPLQYRFTIGEWTWPSPPGPQDDPTVMPSVPPAALTGVRQIEETLVGHVTYPDALSPAPVTITAADADPDGWITVNGKTVTVPISFPPGATTTVTVSPGNFLRTDALLLLNSLEITAAHPPKLPGGLVQTDAGRSLAATEQEPIRKYRLQFEVRDAVTHAPVFTDTLSAIILNNSGAIVALDLEELLTNLCQPLAGQSTAHVLYTVDHPHLRSFQVAIGNNGGTVHPPPAFSGSPTTAMPSGAFTAGSFFFRGGASGPHVAGGTGGVAVDISGDPPCAYRVTLSWQTRRYGDSGSSTEILYCK
jgi:hypothetical protein